MDDTFLSTVRWLHVGLSSRCNAWCPGCPRNKNGFGLADGLVEQDLSLDRLKEVLDTLPSCKTVQLCGNFGDPIAAKNINDVIDYLLEKDYEIIIHTNGSLKTIQWWDSLGKKLKDRPHKVYFGIDGLEDTHAYHRQGTNWHKIISNAKSFIAAGGHAIWQLIPYKFNEHQITACLKMSQELGFKQFYFVKTPDHIDVAYDYKTGEPYPIEDWSHYSRFSNEFTRHNTNAPSCMHLDYPSLYLGETGLLAVCCFMPDLEYNNDVDIKTELRTTPRSKCTRNCNFK